MVGLNGNDAAFSGFNLPIRLSFLCVRKTRYIYIFSISHFFLYFSSPKSLLERYFFFHNKQQFKVHQIVPDLVVANCSWSQEWRILIYVMFVSLERQSSSVEVSTQYLETILFSCFSLCRLSLWNNV